MDGPGNWMNARRLKNWQRLLSPLLYIVSVRGKAESVSKVVEQLGGINDVSLYSSLVREGVISGMISSLDSVVCCVPGRGYKLYDFRRAKIDERMEGERGRGGGFGSGNIVIILEWRLNRMDLQQPCKRAV